MMSGLKGLFGVCRASGIGLVRVYRGEDCTSERGVYVDIVEKATYYRGTSIDTCAIAL